MRLTNVYLEQLWVEYRHSGGTWNSLERRFFLAMIGKGVLGKHLILLPRVVEQVGRTIVLHRRKPKPRGNSSFTQSPRESACLHVTGLLVSSREYKLDYKRIPSLGPACLQGGGWGSGVGQGNVGLQLEP